MLFKQELPLTTAKQKRADTLTQFVLLCDSIYIVSQGMGVRAFEMGFTKSWVMSELFITRYHATKLLNTCVGLGILHKRSNRYSINIESPLYNLLNDLAVGY